MPIRCSAPDTRFQRRPNRRSMRRGEVQLPDVNRAAGLLRAMACNEPIGHLPGSPPPVSSGDVAVPARRPRRGHGAGMRSGCEGFSAPGCQPAYLFLPGLKFLPVRQTKPGSAADHVLRIYCLPLFEIGFPVPCLAARHPPGEWQGALPIAGRALPAQQYGGAR